MKAKYKIIAIVTAALAAATVLSGCRTARRDDNSSAAKAVEIRDDQRLTASEYRTKLVDTFQRWEKENISIANALYGGSEFQLTQEQFDDTVRRSRGYLDEFGLFYPPKSFDKLMNDMLLTLDTEYKWLDEAENAYSHLSDEDKTEFDAASERLQKYGNESKFPSAMLSLMSELKKEIKE
jgi:predicted small secreted protein